MSWSPNAATLRLQAIKNGKNLREAETKPAKSETKAPKNETKSAPAAKKVDHSGKKGRKIKGVAKKRARQLRQYRKLRKEYLAAHELCEIPVEGCTFTATEIHHIRGRENGLLLDIKFFKAACSNCHRLATDKSREAIADGRSASRHKKS